MKANMKRTKDVIVSMEPSKHRKVYHRPGCIYVERIKPQNKMIISKKQAQKYRYQSCKYCNGLVGEVRTNELLPVWECTSFSWNRAEVIKVFQWSKTDVFEEERH